MERRRKKVENETLTKIERQAKHHKNPNPKIIGKSVFEEAKGEDSIVI